MSQVIELSRKLISIPSYSGVNLEIIEYISSYLENMGFACDKLDYDGDESYKVNNLHAVFNPTNSQKILYFAGHTDIVNEGNKSLWSCDPFLGKIEDGKFYGRGAVDMKCAIAAFMCAAKEFLKLEKNPKFGIGFLITNDEEADGVNGTKKVLEWMKKNNKKITHAIVGEPTNPNKLGEMIKVGRRGSVSFEVKIIGKQGHVAYPENAINPITILTNLLYILKNHKFDEGTQFFDPSNLEVTSLNCKSLGGNVIPNEASAAFNVRFNDLHSSQSIIDLVKYTCEKSSVFLGAKYEISYKISGEAFISDPKFLSEIVVKANEKICGKKPVLSTSGGTSDARFIKDYAEVVEIGLVNKTAHKIDEFAQVLEIENLEKIYLEILKNFENGI